MSISRRANRSWKPQHPTRQFHASWMHRRDRRCCTADRRKWSFLLNTTVLTAHSVFPKMNSYNGKLKQHCTFAPPRGLATSGLFGPRPVAGPAQGLATSTLQCFSLIVLHCIFCVIYVFVTRTVWPLQPGPEKNICVSCLHPPWQARGFRRAKQIGYWLMMPSSI